MDEDPQACALATALRPRELIGAYRAADGGLAYTASSTAWFGMGCLNRDPDGGLRQANRLKRTNQRTYVEIWKAILGVNGVAASDGLRPSLVLADEERARALTVLRRLGIRPTERVIGFNPGAGERWPAKRLSPQQAVAIARVLSRALNLWILLLGGPAERTRNRWIAQQAGGAVLDAGTQHPVRVFAALIERCALLLTSDSLALHIALALRTPVVAFFGPTAGQEVDVGEQGIKLTPSPPCRCFYARRCRFATSCVDRIGPRRFVEAAAQLQ
jgi:ADP-heptose:LPS heptosyltransferase